MANKKSGSAATRKTKTSSQKKSPHPSSNQRSNSDQPLRDHLLFLLKDGGAHIGFDDALAGWPIESTGVKVAQFPHTAWMLIEHMRIAQWDIVEFTRSAKHASPKWPEGYWPSSDKPASEKAWSATVSKIKKDMQTMQQLVADRKNDLFAPIPWGDGQTLLRQALLMADHNAYHLGQLVVLKKAVGT